MLDAPDFNPNLIENLFHTISLQAIQSGLHIFVRILTNLIDQDMNRIHWPLTTPLTYLLPLCFIWLQTVDVESAVSCPRIVGALSEFMSHQPFNFRDYQFLYPGIRVEDHARKSQKQSTHTRVC